MWRLAITLLVLLAPRAVLADGLPLKDGRYPGSVLEFDLTLEQMRVIDRFRTCHLERAERMNIFTPYIFELTPTQANAIQAKVGFTPAKFEVYETYRGFNDAGPHWNLVLRYSERRIEVPLDLLLPNGEANQAQVAQGWRSSNPCFPTDKAN